jgi:L-lactate dehydrogenase complex protein LldG
MNNDHRSDWLAQLDEQSRRRQQSFMDGIAQRLGRPRVLEKPAHPFRGAADFWNGYELPLEVRVAIFTENFVSAGGHVVRLADSEALRRFIVEKAVELGAARIVRNAQRELDSLDLEAALPETRISVWNNDADVRGEAERAGYWKARAAEADIGIVAADYAAAHTGSITVLSSKDKGRSVSLLPAVLMAVVPVERLKTRLGEILVDFDRIGREHLPAGIHFISGPSRSADIENDLTIGVHGPGVVYALIVG